MSKKRTSPESSTEKQTNEDSDLFQNDDNAKREKLASLSDTTLQDLPMELIELILIKAVAMEVMGMTRKNSEWREAAEPVISRLTTVCSQWNSILTTNYFRYELHRTFDAEKTLRLEFVQKFRITSFIIAAIPLKDELFILCLPQYYDTYSIDVYDLNNVAVAKDYIPLAGTEVEDIAGCNVSNCLYLLNNKAQNLSILRVTKTDEHQFDISPLISNLQRRNDNLSVASNGNLVLARQRRKEQCAVGIITVYGPDGQLLHETKMSSDACSFFYKVIPKSNGNFVLASKNDQRQMKLIEIDVGGTILRQYQSSLRASGAVCHADKYGRIVIANGVSGIELLDSELNQLEYTDPQLCEVHFNYLGRMEYNRDRNEVVTAVDVDGVTIFRFTEE